MDRKIFRSYLNFETLSKLFFDLAEERYPASEKVKQITDRIVNPMTKDSLENVYIQIAVLNSMRDMVKQVAPGQLYRSLQHRDELYMAIIEALEDLEDKLEDLEENLAEEKDEI